MGEAPPEGNESGAREWRRWVLWAGLVVLLLALVFLALRHEEHATCVCPNCSSTMELEYRGFRVPGLPAFGGSKWSEFHPSTLYVEVFGSSCAHLWPVTWFRQKRGAFEGESEASSPRQGNPLSEAYVASPAFRTLVLERLRSGALTRDRAKALFSVMREPKRLPGVAWKSTPQWSVAEKQLIEEAIELLRAAGVDPPKEWK